MCKRCRVTRLFGVNPRVYNHAALGAQILSPLTYPTYFSHTSPLLHTSHSFPSFFKPYNMFVYTGKLKWQSEAVDEVLVVVLPSGPVRLGDQIFTFSQWTHDSKGNKKVTWCQQQTIDKVTRDDNGSDNFHFGAGWYKYQVVAARTYEALTITMGSPGTYTTVMDVQRVYLSGGETSNGSARLWAGRLNWCDFSPLLLIFILRPQPCRESKSEYS